MDEDGRISVVTEEYMRDISEKKEFPTSMRTSMGMLISWESRPSLGPRVKPTGGVVCFDAFSKWL